MNESGQQVSLEIKGLTKSFGEHYALIELDVIWHRGEVCALLGPNGAGKSTLLNLLSTLQAASEGEISLDGQTLTRQSASDLRKSIGFVGHQTMIYGALTALENLSFFAELYDCWPSDVNPKQRQEWLLEQLRLVGLEQAAHRLANGFSRGMCQRLTLARALLPEPSVLLLDEPFTGLDRAGIQQICDLILKAKTRGATVILSSHDLESTQAVSDRALILKSGRLQGLYTLDKGRPKGSLLELYQGSVI